MDLELKSVRDQPGVLSPTADTSMAAAKPSLVGTYLVPMHEKYLPQVQATEAALYPADEAASADGLEFRMRNAGDFFYVALSQADELIGYVCGTTTNKDSLGMFSALVEVIKRSHQARYR